MPSPSTPRPGLNRQGRKAPANKTPRSDGSPLAPTDNNTVRDRIRQWQLQGGGVVSAPVTDDDEGENEKPPPPPPPPKRTPRSHSRHCIIGCRQRWEVEYELEDPPPRKEPSQQRPSTQEATGSRRPSQRLPDEETPRRRAIRRKEDENINRPRSISTPRKRVVSDEHWRERRRSLKSGEPSRSTRRPATSRSPAEDDVRQAVDQRPASSKATQRTPGDFDAMEPAVENHGVRAHATPSPSPRSHVRRRPAEREMPNTEPSADESARLSASSSPHASTSARPSRAPSSDQSPKTAHQLAARKRSSAQHREMPPKVSPKALQGAFSDLRESKRANRGILGQVKGMFQKNEPATAPAPPTSSVEKWLNGTDPSDDPFITVEPPADCAFQEDVVVPKVASKDGREPLASTTRANCANGAEEDLNETPKDAEDGGEENRRVYSHRRRRKRLTRSPAAETPATIDPGPVDISLADPLQQQERKDGETPEMEKSGSTPPRASLRRRRATRSSPHTPRRERRKASRRTEDPSSLHTGSPQIEQENRPSAEEKTPQAETVAPPKSPTVAPLQSPTIAPPKPPNVKPRRPFPSVGNHPLSTILSVDTRDPEQSGGAGSPTRSNTTASRLYAVTEHSHSTSGHGRGLDHPDPSLQAKRPSTRGQLTKHSDLMSVLSLPRGASKSIRSAHSTRSRGNRMTYGTIEEAMSELAVDERRYMRELQTLVDGVIPVLLSSVLSKSESAAAAGLFRKSASASDEADLTSAIIDMGIALERLKMLHRRIPLRDAHALLTWAHGAMRTYQDYLKCWRLGFQDVVVNLEPAADKDGSTQSAESKLDGGLPRNDAGDIVNSRGEMVDVAFLLRRPLVRTKYLAKILRVIGTLQPSNEAEDLVTAYEDLVSQARNRSNEERARLEDEAAANIDTSKARDPCGLGPLSEVLIERSRRVRARDCFDLTLLHSSGQKIDCRVEMLFRDDPPDQGSGGDILICEVDGKGRWLLFPPIGLDKISARNGDREKEIVVMMRGADESRRDWHEILILKGDDEQAGFEWVQMLGLTPMPPSLERAPSMIGGEETPRLLLEVPAIPDAAYSIVSRVTSVKAPSVQGSEVPIGEKATGSVKRWKNSPRKRRASRHHRSTAKSDGTDALHGQRATSAALDSFAATPMSAEAKVEEWCKQSSIDAYSKTHAQRDRKSPDTARTDKQDMAERSPTTLKRSRAKRISRNLGQSSPEAPATPDIATSKGEAPPPPPHRVKRADSEPLASHAMAEAPSPAQSLHGLEEFRPSLLRTKSVAPSQDLPKVSKLRGQSSATLAGQDSKPDENSASPREDTHRRKRRHRTAESQRIGGREDKPPPAPVHGSSTPPKLKIFSIPDFGAGLRKLQRRSSSPLKHQYDPASPTGSATSHSDRSTVQQQEETPLSSDSSEDEFGEEGDVPTPLMPIGNMLRIQKKPTPHSLPSLPPQTIGPSSSASQAPYKTVPPQPQQARQALAVVSYWTNAGAWIPLHGEECSIVITPGQIDVHELSAAHAAALRAGEASSTPHEIPQGSKARPLIALGLTPLVLIHGGTALDITVRSPPLPQSQRKKEEFENTYHFLFRSRSPQDSLRLYECIHWARMNNPTWLQLEHARETSAALKYGGASFNRAAPPQRSGGLRPSSWFGGRSAGFGRRGSYRASSAPAPSMAKTGTSRGSMASAASAWQRFRKSSRFSIARSTITSRYGAGSDGSDGSGSLGTRAQVPGADGNIGLANCVVKLYQRERGGSGWRDVGKGFLAVRRPAGAAGAAGAAASAPASADATPEAGPSTATSPSSTPAPPAHAAPPAAGTQIEKKRVVVTSKKGEVLFDATLAEDAFEYITRTAIAVRVWEEFADGTVAKTGGVGLGRSHMFMFHLSSEAEAYYTFQIVGKLRY